MNDLIVIIPAFIFTIALLVAIHEFGHFWVARKFNVKVLRFSIGFGKPLYRFMSTNGETEYVVASIPLGGYVKMLDEREGEVAQDELHRAFNRQSVYARFAIVFAGPFINFIFAIFAFWLMFVIGIQGVKPLVGYVDESSLSWDAGLRAGDRIIAVNDRPTPTLSAVYENMIGGFIERQPVTLTLSNQNVLTLPFDKLSQSVEATQLKQLVGIHIAYPKEDVVLGEVLPDSPAAEAGILKGDQIITIDGIEIQHWTDLVRNIIHKPDQSVHVEYLRHQRMYQTDIKVGVVNKDGQLIGRIGVRPESVTPLPESMFTVHQYGFFEAIPHGIEKTWELSVLTVKMLGRILVGQASVKNISGPITIAEVAGDSARMGIESFLRFLAIISLSLGVINLLPIPMLDGGHLLYYMMEMVKGSPVSESTQEIGLKIGISILVMLMSLALYNDFTRLLN